MAVRLATRLLGLGQSERPQIERRAGTLSRRLKKSLFHLSMKLNQEELEALEVGLAMALMARGRFA
jgi:hypothetical protein